SEILAAPPHAFLRAMRISVPLRRCCDETEQQTSYCSQNENSNALIGKRDTPRVIFQRSPLYYDVASEGCNQVQQANCYDKSVGDCCEQSYQTQVSDEEGQGFMLVDQKRCTLNDLGSASFKGEKRLFLNSDNCAENTCLTAAINNYNVAEMENKENEVESCNTCMNNYDIIHRRGLIYLVNGNLDDSAG
ncbi:16608_t:CDS:2, partial [Acaulospora colombiana]